MIERIIEYLEKDYFLYEKLSKWFILIKMNKNYFSNINSEVRNIFS